MTPREIAERHCNVVEGDGCYCLSVCGTLEPFATKADAEKARAGCLDGLTAALAAANIRVLGPGEGVVRVRVCKAGEAMPHGALWSRGDYYLFASDLDAIAGRVGT